jgi:hypothetical protein
VSVAHACASAQQRASMHELQAMSIDWMPQPRMPVPVVPPSEMVLPLELDALLTEAPPPPWMGELLAQEAATTPGMTRRTKEELKLRMGARIYIARRGGSSKRPAGFSSDILLPG